MDELKKLEESLLRDQKKLAVEWEGKNEEFKGRYEQLTDVIIKIKRMRNSKK